MQTIIMEKTELRLSRKEKMHDSGWLLPANGYSVSKYRTFPSSWPKEEIVSSKTSTGAAHAIHCLFSLRFRSRCRWFRVGNCGCFEICWIYLRPIRKERWSPHDGWQPRSSTLYLQRNKLSNCSWFRKNLRLLDRLVLWKYRKTRKSCHLLRVY